MSAPSDECRRIARSFRERGLRTIGLLPVPDGSSALRLGVELGAALVEHIRTEVAVLTFRPHLTGLPGHERLARFSLGPSLTLVAPRTRAPLDPGACISVAAERYPYLLVDLFGLCERGEQLGAVDLLDGTALVARIGLAHEHDLLQRSGEIPADRNLGVLLLGDRVAHRRVTAG